MRSKKTQFSMIALFVITLGIQSLFGQSSVPYSDYGVWNRGGETSFNPNNDNYDYLRGVTKQPRWSEIQPTKNGPYDWSEFAEAFMFAENTGQAIALKIDVGPDSPSWLYNNGVPLVESRRHKYTKFPYYLDDDYINFYYQMIDDFADFVFSLPQSQQDILSFIFPQTGATGDEAPYKGTILSSSAQYKISTEDWLQFRLDAFEHWKEAFVTTNPVLFPFYLMKWIRELQNGSG